MNTNRQPDLLYRGTHYCEGDYITLAFHRGLNDSLIAREDSGRIILLEDGHDLDICPRDVVDCIVVAVKEQEPDWTGKRRGGFSMVRAIQIKEKAPAPTVREIPSEPVPEVLTLVEEDSTEDTEERPLKEPSSSATVETESEFTARLAEHVLKADDNHEIHGYPRYIRVNAIVYCYDNYSQCRWHPRTLTNPQKRILRALHKKEVLVALLHPEDESQIITPYCAKVQGSYVKIPKALKESVRPFQKCAVILQLHKVPE